jgi:UDPglucose--hexose-1-phosphate uridylyltransferase
MNLLTDMPASKPRLRVGFNRPAVAMNETRYDWLSDRWVIFAPNREERPDEFRQSKKSYPTEHVECPFCFGAELATPEPTLVLPAYDYEMTSTNRRGDPAKPTQLPWQVRVVPNKFPAIPRHVSESEFAQSTHSSMSSDYPVANRVHGSKGHGQLQLQTVGAEHLFQKHVPSGAHEVIIESPTHVDSIAVLPVEQISLILEAYRIRLNYWRAQRDLKYAVVFKNYGSDAGASLFHSHSQLISLDFVPSDIDRVNERLIQYHKQYGRCYICQFVEEEEERQERLVFQTENFVALCPFASRFPYSFSIIPRTHRCRYEEISPSERDDLARIAKATLSALESAHPSAAYNFVLQTSPFRGGHEESFHWRLRVIPRLSKVAGFEWGSDCFINTVTPEYAARVLRDHLD